tara:strand:+ start:1180 stop:1296 length:117 start_codon:yes stop_codon:yes gene_type:complete
MGITSVGDAEKILTSVAKAKPPIKKPAREGWSIFNLQI